MEKDAQTHIQLIDTYFSERLNDVKILSASRPLKSLLSGNRVDTGAVSDLLFSAFHRDVADYISISVLNTQAQVVLTYPAAPQSHGSYLIQPEALTQLQTSSGVVASDGFYDPLANNPSIDLYARVFNDNFQPLGTIRASISLHRLWEPINSETQANGPGSYAFVLDQHGVRIAYTNPDHSGFTRPQYLFKAIAPLSTSFQGQIQNENLYGNSANPVTSIDDTTLASLQNPSQQTAIFQFNPAGQGQAFVAARYSSAVFPWTYFVLKPLNAVTGLADQQLQTVILIVSIVILFAVIIGGLAGRRIALPIMRSVLSLRNSSEILKGLAEQEETVATEQTWMVEASQIAMKSVKYYTFVVRKASRRLAFLCKDLKEDPRHFDQNRLTQVLNEMAQMVEYIELAMKYQEQVNEKLASSIRMTTQTATQLTRDAKSTDETAAQLEQIVQQLTRVVGTSTLP
ncbi:MAG: cache domain-containing protein [Chloroflexota bacterium]|nr:cache domain-containing protein [Chloroflexota bacterium]